MADRIRIVMDADADGVVREAARAEKAIGGVGKAAQRAARDAKVYQDAQGRWREANGRFVSSARQAELGLKRLSDAGGRAARSTGALSAAVTKQRQTLDQLSTAARRAALGLGLLAGAGLAKAARDGLKFNAQMESNTLALERFLGGAGNARKFLDDLFETAKKTPFEFTDLTTASRRLLAFGLSANQTKRTLNALGDAIAAAGGGAEQIQRVTLALGQMQAKGKVSAEELLQLTEAGIPAYKILREELNLTNDEVAKIGLLGISSERAIQALTRGMERDFQGAAAEQAKTFDGMMATLRDNWAQTTGAMTEGLFEEIKQWTPQVNRTMEEIAEVFNRDDLSLEAKIDLSRASLGRNLGPLFDELKREIDRADLGDKLLDAFEDAFPKIADAAARGGGKATVAFVNGWMDAGPWGKLVTAAFLASKLGAFSGGGRFAARKFGDALKERVGPSLKRIFTTASTSAALTAGEAGADAMVTGTSRGVNKQRTRLRAIGTGIGRTVGVAVAVAIAAALNDKLSDLFAAEGTGHSNVGDPAGANDPNHPLRGLIDGINDVLGFRKGGVAFAAGGLVPAAVSSGELLVGPDGSTATVPGPRVAADNIRTALPAGTMVFTDHGQQLLAGGASMGEALRHQMPHFATGGVLGQFTSTAYGPPWNRMNGTGVTRGGTDLRKHPQQYIVAVDPKVIPLGSKVTADPNPFGQKGLVFKADDTGGAIKGNRIDFYDWRGRRSQLAWGRKKVTVSRASGSGGRFVDRQGPVRSGFRPLSRGEIDLGQLRTGLVPDAFQTAFGAARAGEPTDLLEQILEAARVPLARDTFREFRPEHSRNAAGRAMGRGSASLIQIGKAAQKKGLRVAEHPAFGGVGPGHTSTSWHYKGRAIDVSGATGLMSAFANSVAGTHGRSLKELFWRGPQWVNVKNGQRVGRDFVSGHTNHVHVAMRRGGRVPGLRQRVGSLGGLGATDNTGAARGLKDLAEALRDVEAVTFGRLDRLADFIRAEIKRLAKGGLTGEERASAHRLRGALSLVEAEAGTRVGRLVRRADNMGAADERAATVGGMLTRRLGIDPGSSRGLQLAADQARVQGQGIGDQVGVLRQALARAKRMGKKDTAREIQQRIDELNLSAQELATQAIENQRAAIAQAAAEQVGTAEHGTRLQSEALRGLELQQRLAGTFDTAGGAQGRADFIQQSIIPSLQATLGPLAQQLQVAQEQGNTPLAQQIAEQIAGRQNDILQAQLDAQEIMAEAARNAQPNFEELFNLQKQINQDLRASLRVAGAQFGVFRNFAPLVGSFAIGTQGRRVGRTGLAYVHADEVISPQPRGPQTASPAQQPVNVTLVLEGDSGSLVRMVDARIDTRAPVVVSQQIGRRSRMIAAAPGIR